MTVEEKLLCAARVKSESVATTQVLEKLHTQTLKIGLFSINSWLVGCAARLFASSLPRRTACSLIFLLNNVRRRFVEICCADADAQSVDLGPRHQRFPAYVDYLAALARSNR